MHLVKSDSARLTLIGLQALLLTNSLSISQHYVLCFVCLPASADRTSIFLLTHFHHWLPRRFLEVRSVAKKGLQVDYILDGKPNSCIWYAYSACAVYTHVRAVAEISSDTCRDPTTLLPKSTRRDYLTIYFPISFFGLSRKYHKYVNDTYFTSSNDWHHVKKAFSFV